MIKYYCDIDGSEIDADSEYYVLDLHATNSDGYHGSRRDAFFSDKLYRPIDTNLNMVCKKCAMKIAELVKVAIPNESK